MKVLALFDKSGKIHALFHPSTDRDVPQLSFSPQKGRIAQMLEVPVEFRHLAPGQLHAGLKVELRGGAPRLVAHGKKPSRKKKR